MFFGKVHTDQQWETLLKMPGLKYSGINEIIPESVMSLTLPICLPFLGGGMLMGADKIPYEIGSLYIHDGLKEHAIAPFNWPVLPIDWRISIQAHGLWHDDRLYLYW